MKFRKLETKYFGLSDYLKKLSNSLNLYYKTTSYIGKDKNKKHKNWKYMLPREVVSKTLGHSLGYIGSVLGGPLGYVLSDRIKSGLVNQPNTSKFMDAIKTALLRNSYAKTLRKARKDRDEGKISEDEYNNFRDKKVLKVSNNPKYDKNKESELNNKLDNGEIDKETYDKEINNLGNKYKFGLSKLGSKAYNIAKIQSNQPINKLLGVNTNLLKEFQNLRKVRKNKTYDEL